MNTPTKIALLGTTIAAHKLVAYTKQEAEVSPTTHEINEGPSAVFNIFILFALLSVIALVIWRLLNGNEPDSR